MFDKQRFVPVITLAAAIALLVACDSASMPYEVVTLVTATEHNAFAQSIPLVSWGVGCCPDSRPKYYVTHDAGKTWEVVEADIPSEVASEFAIASQRSEKACEPADPSKCVKVNGAGRVEKSQDGGETWKASPLPWTDSIKRLAHSVMNPGVVCSEVIPKECYRINDAGRIERSKDSGATWIVDWSSAQTSTTTDLRTHNGPRLIGVSEDLYPYDLAILDTPEGVVVLATMGNQGVLSRTPDGAWEGYGVGLAVP